MKLIHILVLLGSISALFLSSCVPIKKDLLSGLKKGKFYKRDMKISAGGYSGEGWVVLPEAESYEIEIEAKGKLDLLTFETIHGVKTIEEGWTHRGFFGTDKNKGIISYKPNQLIENGEYSSIARIGGYEKKKGRHSWAIVLFESKELQLPGKVNCEWDVYHFTGVGGCQSKAGTIQAIEFKQPVFYSNSGCGGLDTEDDKTFRLRLSVGECVYRFKEKDIGREFRLTTMGHEGIHIRNP